MFDATEAINDIIDDINSDYYAFALPVSQSKALDYKIIKESKCNCDEIYNEVIY